MIVSRQLNSWPTSSIRAPRWLHRPHRPLPGGDFTNASVWRGEQMVYPLNRLGPPPHPDMPDAVRELYEEAAAVAAVSRRAGAALARATVERLLKTLDPEAPKTATLEKRIDRIRDRVSTPLAELLDVLRVTGNGAVHVDDEPDKIVVIALDDEEGPALLELLLEAANDLVDELDHAAEDQPGAVDRLPERIRAKRAASAPPGPAGGGEGA